MVKERFSCQSTFLLKERIDTLSHIFLLGHLLFTEDQLNLLLGLGSIGYVLYGTSSQVFNEGSFTKMKGKQRLIVGIVFAREQPVKTLSRLVLEAYFR